MISDTQRLIQELYRIEEQARAALAALQAAAGNKMAGRDPDYPALAEAVTRHLEEINAALEAAGLVALEGRAVVPPSGTIAGQSRPQSREET